MAGTRLVAHTCFLVFSLISVLVAWRLGVVSRAPLPLKVMANLSSTLPSAVPVDIDLVVLRNTRTAGVVASSSGVDCPSCASILDAMQSDPSLVRDVFLSAEQLDRRNQQKQAGARAGSSHGSSTNEQDPEQPLFFVRDVDLRYVYTVPSAAALEPPVSQPEALDEWLVDLLIPYHKQYQHAGAKPTKAALSVTDNGRRSASAVPLTAEPSASFTPTTRYTFFVGCSGGGASGQSPVFIMGKHRHGYLGLGCGCSCSHDGNDAGNDPHIDALGVAARAAAAAAALAVVQSLAEIIMAHVLRSPVSPGDVHARLGQAYRLNFSLMSEDPAVRQCTWDFASASRRYLRPLLTKLNPVASFAVQSQEVAYAKLSRFPPRQHPRSRRWYYSPQDLKGFLGVNDFSILDLDDPWGAAPTDGNSIVSGEGAVNVTDINHRTTSSPHGQVPVNFMVFCPSSAYSPLVFMEEWVGAGSSKQPAAEAYEVPGFGGVSVINGFRKTSATSSTPKDATSAVDSSVDVVNPERIRRALGAHAAQLRRIIGLPRPADRPTQAPWPRISFADGLDSGKITSTCQLCSVSQDPPPTTVSLVFLPSPQDGATEWEVDALVRARLAHHRRAAADTLRSLAALVESSSEMEISNKIADDVSAALAALRRTDATVISGQSTSDAASPVGRSSGVGGGEGLSVGRRALYDDGARRALRWARESLQRAEAAYFDPTMIPQLYFPEDHLVAVYMPFLGPLAFPLLWGFAQEVRRYRRKLQAKKKNEE
ncbi:unnamed protein product, partial [Sphacelaria rigidula]